MKSQPLTGKGVLMTVRAPRRLSRRSLLRTSAALPVLLPGTAATQEGTSPATPEASPVPEGPQLRLLPDIVQFDQRFDVVVTGLQPGEEVTITATFEDRRRNTWTATAAYKASREGVLWGSRAVPVHGDFGVADPMAFIWAASSPSLVASLGGYAPVYTGEEVVTFTATHTAGVSTAVLRRLFPASATDPVDNLKSDLFGRYYAPVGGGPAPAIIQVGGSDGGLGPYLETPARLLNSLGYGVLSLAYFGALGLPQSLEGIPIEYFGEAIDWLQQRPEIDGERIGMYGYSRGGEAALLTAVHYPAIRAVAAVNGSGLVIPGLGGLNRGAWTWQAKDIPYLTENDVTREQQQQKAIPVEEIQGPILMLVGEADMLWDASVLSEFARERWTTRGHPYADHLLSFPGQGHLFAEPFQPVSSFVDSRMGGFQEQTAAATEPSWRALCQHFATALRPWS